MRAGKLKDRITIQKSIEKKDSSGSPYQEWEDYITLWADVQPLDGKEFWEAQKSNAQISGIIEMRFRTDINKTMRAKYGNRILALINVYDPDERRRKIHLLYQEVE